MTSDKSYFELIREYTRRGVDVFKPIDIDIEVYDEEKHGSLITYDGVEGYEEVDRYWINEPYSFVSIRYNESERDYLYDAVEPDLTEFQQTILQNLLDDMHDSLVYRATSVGTPSNEDLKRQMADLLEEYGINMDMNGFYRLYYYLHRTFKGYGKIDVLMNDPHIEDISCDGYGIPVFVYHDQYTDIETNISYNRDELDNYVVRLAQQSGKHISIGEPVTETTLPDGSRGELALGEEVTPRGSAFTIRKYSEEPFTPISLLEYGTFNIDQLAYLWFLIENKRSLVFAGGTASGKTTTMNAVSMFVPPNSKVITIEDTRELTLYHDNWLSGLTRDSVDDALDITMYDLLRSSLRHRPEYIIVGEVRGEEATTLFQAMNTGHTTFSTMHADSIETAINRLENEPINVPRSMIESLDVLLVQRLTEFEGERVRRNKAITEIRGIDKRSGNLNYSNVYQRSAKDDTFAESDSNLLREISDDKGWSQAETKTELHRRRRILQYMLEKEIDTYRAFTQLVNHYYKAPENLVRVILDDPEVDIDFVEEHEKEAEDVDKEVIADEVADIVEGKSETLEAEARPSTLIDENEGL